MCLLTRFKTNEDFKTKAWLRFNWTFFFQLPHLSSCSPVPIQSAGPSSATWVSWGRGPLQSSPCAPASGPRPLWRFVAVSYHCARTHVLSRWSRGRGCALQISLFPLWPAMYFLMSVFGRKHTRHVLTKRKCYI